MVAWTGVNLMRLLLACTFVLSGIVKLIDPHGTEYKIQDYAQVFGLSSLVSSEVALMLAVALAVCEFTFGVFVFFGMRKRLSSDFILVFMLVMTPLTLYLALTDPVHDCGCFGDALILTNWQTFFKNMILLAAALTVRMGHRTMPRLISENNQWLVSLYSWTFALIFAGINLYRLPLIDFRPYHIGADLGAASGMMQSDVKYETFFIMEKDGKRQEFSLEDYPDSTWTFVDTRTETIGNATKTDIDLRIQNVNTGEEITQDILQTEGYVFLLTSPQLELADDGVMDRIMVLHDYCRENGYRFVCLTSSGEETIANWQEMTGAEYEFYHADAIELKTMVRSNPGLMLLYDGVVVNKWSSAMLPTEEELGDKLERLPLANVKQSTLTERGIKILLWYLIPLALLTMADRLWVAWKLRKLYKIH